MTLTDFLLARIAEDEAAARAATPGPWRWDNDEFFDAPKGSCQHGTDWRDHGPDLISTAPGARVEDDEDDTCWVISATGYDASSVNILRGDAEHIASWNPARVLAECEAKRRIVQEWDEAHPADGGLMYGLETAIRALAAVYADHPDYRDDYRDEWSV